MLQKCMNSLRHFSVAAPTRPPPRACTRSPTNRSGSDIASATKWSALRRGRGPVYEYVTEHYVHAMPSAILAIALVLLAFLSLRLRLIVNSTNLRLLELEKLICKRLNKPGG
jgi:hypothetical protein